MPFNFLNQGQTDETATSFRPIDTFIDPVSKIRVSNPANLIDTDFEYGLQPTKWETVEIINNTPAFFSKSGDTTIPDLTGITTNAGTREITVTTAFPHNLDVGIPIRVSGTKSLTADGSYIINATPTPTTFTYLSRANQVTTISIFDLYSSIITGEFFQGSQISISDAEGMTTDGVGPSSTITIKTANRHGFGPKTPFYFLNLNSTVSQEFESTNSTSLSFDPTNSATAQSFDGSNTLIQTPIDLSNSATTSIHENEIISTDPDASTFTIRLVQEDLANWTSLQYGDPLYYNVNIGSGYFQANPRGVVFIKSTALITDASLDATFQVSLLPDGDPIPVIPNITGYFQVADQARTFAGNNENEQSQIEIPIIVGEEIEFDAENKGYVGDPLSPIDNSSTVVGYTGETMTVFTAEGILDYYVGAMLTYSTDGTPATGLQNNRTYFVTYFEPGQSSGLYTMSIAEYPGEANINVSGGSGTQTFDRLGISLDKDIIHVQNSNFQENDMLEYSFPTNGAFVYDAAEVQKRFFYVATAYDAHNYELNEDIGFRSVTATGGQEIIGRYIDTSSGTAAPGRFGNIGANAQLYTIHKFTAPGTHTFEITDIGIEGQNTIEYLVVGGGGGGGNDMGGGGGGGGVLSGSFVPTEPGTYEIVVGRGGRSNANGYRTSQPQGERGQDSSAFGVTALGGGAGAGGHRGDNQTSRSGENGASGGGEAGRGQNNNAGAGTPGQGFRGGNSGGDWYSGAGGGAGARASDGRNSTPGNGIVNDILGFPYFWGGGGAKGGYSNYSTAGGRGGGGGGGHFGRADASGLNPSEDGLYGNCCQDRWGGNGGVNTGGGAGGHAHRGGEGSVKFGGSGIVVVRYLGAPQAQDDFISATGGIESTIVADGLTYRVHAFTQTGSQNFVVTGTSDNPDYNFFDYLIVGGGGGGGNDMGGGGGGGGVLQGSIGLETGTYTITVGDGGRSNSNGYRTGAPEGQRGEDSSAFGLVALGGGAGSGGHRGDNQTSRPGRQGASGGGAAGRGQGGVAGYGVLGQGGNGGNSGGDWYAGSGGGAGGNASNGTGSLPGNGVQSDILGTNYYWGGGGGKGGYSNAGARGGLGGGGGGGNGGAGDTNGLNPAENGVPGNCCNQHGGSGGVNTGGGAGGHSHQGGSGSTKRGGSGIVVVRYPIGAA